MMILLTAAVVTMACPSPRHYDGDAIACGGRWPEIAGRRSMRLHAVDAPELDCRDRRGCDRRAALASRDHLRSLTARARVVCTWRGARSYDRLVVECSADGADISCAQLRAGHARYLPRYDRGGRWLSRCR